MIAKLACPSTNARQAIQHGAHRSGRGQDQKELQLGYQSKREEAVQIVFTSLNGVLTEGLHRASQVVHDPAAAAARQLACHCFCLPTPTFHIQEAPTVHHALRSARFAFLETLRFSLFSCFLALSFSLRARFMAFLFCIPISERSPPLLPKAPKPE